MKEEKSPAGEKEGKSKNNRFSIVGGEGGGKGKSAGGRWGKAEKKKVLFKPTSRPRKGEKGEGSFLKGKRKRRE